MVFNTSFGIDKGSNIPITNQQGPLHQKVKAW